jgi:4-hydroxybenzoate polyprenyltransferase
MSNFIALLKTYRPLLLPAPFLIFGLGLLLSDGRFSGIAFIQVFLVTFFAPILVFGVNDVFDYETDSQNPRKLNKFFGGIAEKKYHNFIIKSAILVSSLLILISVLTLNWLNFIAMIAAISTAWDYSFPGINLKSKPLGDVFSNIVGLGSIAVLGVSFGSLDSLFFNVPPERIVGIILALTMASLLAGLADFESDEQAGITTTAIYIGKKWTVVLGLLSILPLTVINFREAEFLKWSIFVIILTYLPLLWLYKNKRIVSLVYGLIAIITMVSFGVYLNNLLLV